MLANAVVLLWLVRRSLGGANSRERRDGVHCVLLSLAGDRQRHLGQRHEEESHQAGREYSIHQVAVQIHRVLQVMR